MPSIVLDNVSFSYSSKPLLSQINLTVGPGERACLVGPNGSGKSTLLAIVQENLLPDSGRVGVPASTPSASIQSCFEDLEQTVSASMKTALSPLRNLISEFESVTEQLEADSSGSATARYDRLLSELERRDAWSIDARLNKALSGLGLSIAAENAESLRLRQLSPGQRTRLQLAALLVLRPPALVLDEPTNHLDDGAVEFLTEVLLDWSGPVLLASHDRAFIEAVATVLYDLDTVVWNELSHADGTTEPGGLHKNSGNYTEYLQAKDKAHRAHRALHAAQQEEKRSIEEHRQGSQKIARGGVRLATAQGKEKKFFADRAAATAVRRTRNDDRRLEHLAEHEVRKPRLYELSFPARAGNEPAGSAIAARDAAITGRLSPTTFDLSYGEHLLLTGPNGSGKSTLISWIADGKPPADTPASGSITRDDDIALVPQRLPKCGDPGFTDDIWHSGVGPTGRRILHPSTWTTPISHLSDGNQRRAQLAVALADQPVVLLIDEPTNYLDLSTLEALEKALASWTGTLVITTHDRWLINHWQGRRLHLEA
ncbi:ABC-F family ATP-binding cassette domain-containing protein [Brevibacterium sp. HMSC22B09]|uniref:ABC-F family ATP-binding cassette domain-containing protein n=1 Tax=Brevibacterium sp. HMSC22B09 TaxID=1581055 RepID=UPI0008A31807|nr:ABC-F family ATP-binding cassette domain-containing protein [Brevibacterium sp. HMSC22B09]OFT98075.1 ABC transporter ATP-binding protein [Brevibacterium sp. HMSC22B09]